VAKPDPYVQAHCLLSGVGYDDEKGLPKTRYFAPRSREDKEGRQAIVDILLSNNPVPRELRKWLAWLFDSEDPGLPCGRQIVFKRRYAGNPENAYRKSAIATEIQNCRLSGLSTNKAVAKTAEKFGIGERQAWDIWKKYGWLYRPNYE
jgi:hypothetical protein